MLSALCILCSFLLGVFSTYFFISRKSKPIITVTTSNGPTQAAPVKQGRLGKRTIYLTPEREQDKAREARDQDGKA